MTPPRALRLAHRGDWRRAPENSLGAMVAALEIPGCDGLEFDVRGSRDDVPVLLHDETLARVQRVDAAVRDLSAAELASHGIPTLEAVLDAVGREPFLDVELKGEPVPRVIPVLEAARGDGNGGLQGTVVSSFEPETIAWIRERRPGWRCWGNVVELTDAVIQAAQRLGCVGLSADWRSIDERSVRRARDAGLELAAWTVRRSRTAQRLDRLGVVAICVEAAALDA